jgi:hypothetical protein
MSDQSQAARQQYEDLSRKRDELLAKREEATRNLYARIERDKTIETEYESRFARLNRNLLNCAKHDALRLLFGAELWGERMRGVTLRHRNFGDAEVCEPPPREMPPELVDRYTLGGRVPIRDHYHDDTYPSNHPLIYTDEEIECYLERIKSKEHYIYGGLDYFLRDAFTKYPIAGLKLANMGSITPWFEATCLSFGCRPTTIEYNTIITRTDRINTMTVADWERDQPRFDCALSISSFEHDGLGAYGDPLDPDGDLKTMKKMKELVKPGGLLYFNVPLGPDTLMWNRARVYGPLRLPMMLEGWTRIDAFGLRQEHLEGKANGDPVLVLRND